jgi:hypothetical protein
VRDRFCSEATRTASWLRSLALVRSTGGTAYRKYTLFEACGNVSAKAFTTEGMSTGINAGDRTHGHIVHTYTALKQGFGDVDELSTLL